MAKKRTTAQRRAAAKAAWVIRRQNAALASAKRPTPNKTPLPKIDYGAYSSLTPTTAGATKEGDELYVTISSAGGVFRHQLSRDTMRKLGLDCLQLVG